MEILKEYPFIAFILSIALLFLAAKFYFKAMGSKHAKEIIKRQFEPADQKVIEAGFKFYSGKKRERYIRLLTRMRQQYGHDGLKIGHQAMLIAVVSDSKQDVDTVQIPPFVDEAFSKHVE
ncbi:MAG: hypothetical protein V7749_00965 [Cocleimonas sp.]